MTSFNPRFGSVSGDPSQFTHVYADAGDYVIAATPVTANGIVDDTAFQNATVNPPAPTLALKVDPASSGPTIVLDAAFNANGATTTGDLIVNWGDGNQQGYAATATVFSHTYADDEFSVLMNGPYSDPPGVYGDGFNVTACILTSVGVASADIGAGVSEYTANVPDMYSWFSPSVKVRLGDAANEENTWVIVGIGDASPPNWVPPSDPGAPIPSTFDWGDDSGPEPWTSYLGDDEKRSHTYANEGVYGVTLAGGVWTSQARITVLGPPLTLSQPDAQTAEPGESVNVTASYTGLVGPGYAFVDWGDGKGPQKIGGNLNSGGSNLPTTGSITARYDRVPTSGLSGTLYLYDMHGNVVRQAFSVSCADETLVTLNPEAVNNGKAGAELVGADKQAGIYVPESTLVNPETGKPKPNRSAPSPTTYWAPFVVHIAPGVKQDPLTFGIPTGLLINTKDDGSGTQIKNRVPFPGLTDGQVLYVEATTVATTVANAPITVTDPVLQALDTLNVTSFLMAGPTDVPQYGTYTYSVSYPRNVNAPLQSAWLSATGGAMTPVTFPGNGQPNPSAAQVQWDAGPIVGRATYRATPNYSWGLNVNVVQIVVGPPYFGAEFHPGSVLDGGSALIPHSNNPLSFKYIFSLGEKPGMWYSASITLNGPNNNQGIGAITTGFMQNLTIAQYQVTYGTAGMPQTYVSGAASVDGNTIVKDTFWDTVTDPKSANPLYNINAVFHGPRSSAGSGMAGSNNVGHISAEDSPEVYLPEQWGKPNTAAQRIVSLNLHFDFDLYVVAQTSEAPPAPVGAYVAEAGAKWSFDASGTIQQGPANLPWTPSPSAGIAFPLHGFSPITSGLNPLTGDVMQDGMPVQYNAVERKHLRLM